MDITMNNYSTLICKEGLPHHRNLVFTSAGDNANLENWLKGDKQFDLWVTYYGDQHDSYRESADYYNARKNGKYPNLHYAYQNWKGILDHYEAIMVMDDDIIINASGISRLFEIRNQFGLWLLQPAFSPSGRISHPITTVHPFKLMRYTNFVEGGVALFQKEILDGFMEVFDPALGEGYGVDWWYLEKIGPDLAGKVAIVDEVYCINPHTKNKKFGKRECCRIAPRCLTMEKWKEIKMLHNIKTDERGYHTFGSVNRIALSDLWVSALYFFSLFKRAVKTFRQR